MQAYTRLQEIHQIMHTDRVMDIGKIVELQKEAKQLYTICKDILHTVKQDMQELQEIENRE